VQGGDSWLRHDQLRLCRRRQIFLVPSGGSFFNFQVANFGHQITILLAAVISQMSPCSESVKGVILGGSHQVSSQLD
jgi:hypothetical protein